MMLYKKSFYFFMHGSCLKKSSFLKHKLDVVIDLHSNCMLMLSAGLLSAFNSL